jgi:hypothetical protein
MEGVALKIETFFGAEIATSEGNTVKKTLSPIICVGIN